MTDAVKGHTQVVEDKGGEKTRLSCHEEVILNFYFFLYIDKGCLRKDGSEIEKQRSFQGSLE